MMCFAFRRSVAAAALLGLAGLAPLGWGQEQKPDPADQLIEELLPPPGPAPAPVKKPAPEKPVADKPAAALSEMSPEDAARLRKELKAVTDRIMVDARAFYRIGDYDHCIDRCNQVLKLDTSHLDAQKLKHQSEKAKIDFRLKMLEQESTTKDKEAIADLDEASNYPDRKPPLARPINAPPVPPLPLRTTGPVAKTEKLLAMEQKLNQRVDINFVDADLDFVMATLFRVTGVNIIADQNALKDKRLTLHVENMPLKEILRFIVRNNSGINYTVTEDAVWVSAGGSNPGLEPRTHALNIGLVNSNPIQAQQNRAAPRQANGNNRGPVVNQPQPGQQPGQQQQQQQQDKTYLEDVLGWMEKWKEWPSGSQWSIDKMSSALLVYTTPEMHDKIDEMLDSMDRTPVQVLISARFITIKVDDLKDLGLDFGINNKSGNKFNVGLNPPAASAGGIIVPNRFAGTDLGVVQGAGLNMLVQSSSTDPLFSAALRALEQKGRSKLLSAPQIITLNNQKGTIDIKSQFNWVSDWREVIVTNTSGLNGTATQSVSTFIPVLSADETHFTLEVTPSVGRDLKHIILELHPFISEVVGGTDQFRNINSVTVVNGQNTPTTNPPVFNDKELMTRLVVNDGDLVIIGGLMGQETTKTNKSVPLLGDIPLLGYLFQHQEDTISKTHLIIVVKAQLIDPSGRSYESANGANGGASETPAKKEPASGPWYVYPEPGAPAAAGK